MIARASRTTTWEKVRGNYLSEFVWEKKGPTEKKKFLCEASRSLSFSIFSLSLHRHSCIIILFSSRIIASKQTVETIKSEVKTFQFLRRNHLVWAKKEKGTVEEYWMSKQEEEKRRGEGKMIIMTLVWRRGNWSTVGSGFDKIFQKGKRQGC